VVELAPAEYRLLYHLACHPGHFLSHDALLERIWHNEWGASNNNLKALVSRLRAKIEPHSSTARFIENQRGIGCRIIVPSPAVPPTQPGEASKLSAVSSSSPERVTVGASL
jgi:DNA-binding response OmpR family regulator